MISKKQKGIMNIAKLKIKESKYAAGEKSLNNK
jgi:hypothetical protein